MTVARAPRLAGVQALRFVAAVLVVLTHATLYTRERLDGSLDVWHFGEIGVDVFFVISGLVMVVSSAGLARHGRTAWKVFAVRRLVRIVPVYWIATTVKLIAVLAVPAVALNSGPGVGHTLLSYFFLPSTNPDGQVEPLLGVGWTLVFEMFFYLVFAVALALRVDVLRFCGVVLTVLALGSVLKDGDWPAATVYFHPRVLYFLAGMVIGRFILDGRRRGLLLGLGYTVAMFTAIRVGAAVEAGSFDLWVVVGRHVVAIGVVLVAVLLEPRVGRRVPAPLLYLGNASYSLYLFHPLIAPAVPAVLARVGLGQPWLSVVLCVVVAVLTTAVVHRIVERPVTSWLERRVPYAGRQPRATSAETSATTVAP